MDKSVKASVQGKELDRTVVQGKLLKGWREQIWFWFGDRDFPRNENTDWGFVSQIIILAAAFGGWAFMHYLPLFFLGLMVFVVTNSFAMFYPVAHVDESAFPGMMNLVVGFVGLYTHYRFGLNLFHHHLEPILYWGYIAGGGLAVLRRLWNALIWALLDKIVVDYYADQGLNAEEHAALISDPMAAYVALQQRLLRLVKHGCAAATPEQYDRISKHLHNYTESGFRQAMAILDKELKK